MLMLLEARRRWRRGGTLLTAEAGNGPLMLVGSGCESPCDSASASPSVKEAERWRGSLQQLCG